MKLPGQAKKNETQKTGKSMAYLSTFFVGMSFENHVRDVNLAPTISDFQRRINFWQGRKPGMELRVYRLSQSELPAFVFQGKSEPSSISGSTPSKGILNLS